MDKKKISLWFEKPMNRMKKMFKKQEVIEYTRPSIETMDINIQDNGNELVAQAPLPGYTKDQIKMKATSRTLEISALKDARVVKQSDGYYKEERESGSTGRMITLPAEINPSKVAAKFENDTLIVTMQKKPKKVARSW